MADDDVSDVSVRNEYDANPSIDKEGLVPLDFYLTPETMAQLEKIAIERNMSVGETAVALMTEYLEKKAEFEHLVKELVVKSLAKEVGKAISPKYSEIMRAKKKEIH